MEIPAKRGKGGIPGILTVLADRIKGYFYAPSVLPSLNMANKSPRQQRSCRREACIQLLIAMLKYTDLTTLKVGYPVPGGFKNLPVRVFAYHAGLSISRAERAFRDIVKSSWVSSTPICDKDKNGHYKGMPSVKVIQKELFAVFGLKSRLIKEREKAAERFKEKMQAITDQSASIADMARQKLHIKSILNKAKPKKQTKPIIKPMAKPPPDLDRSRRLQLKALYLQEQHPRLSRDQLFDIAERLI